MPPPTNTLSNISNSIIDQIDLCLPQTQCTLCTYPRCKDYAKAIARGEAKINQCPPGGDITITALGKLLAKPIIPLNETLGKTEPKKIAYIHEDRCIGCKLCIKACPVDCIVGAAKLMHTVILNDCTGCKLCIPVCPTDCIDLIDPDKQETAGHHPSPWPDFTAQQVQRSRTNTEDRLKRIALKEKRRRTDKKTVDRKQLKQQILEAINRKTNQHKSV